MKAIRRVRLPPPPFERLTDREWKRIAATVEATRGTCGGPRTDLRRAVDAIRRNLTTTRLADRATVVRRGFAGHLQGRAPETPFDLVFLDPPYDLTNPELGRVLGALAAPGWLTPRAAVVVERAANAGPPPLPAGWGVAWERIYGDTLVALVGPGAARDPLEDTFEDSADAGPDPA